MVATESAASMLGYLIGFLLVGYLYYRALKAYLRDDPPDDEPVSDTSTETSTQRQDCPSCGAPVSQGQCISCRAEVGRPDD